MTTVSIYNDPKDKRTFLMQIVQDFQEYEDISDSKASEFELIKEYFSDEIISLQDVNIFTFSYKHNELMLFIERHKEKRQTKRSSSTLNGKKNSVMIS